MNPLPPGLPPGPLGSLGPPLGSVGPPPVLPGPLRPPPVNRPTDHLLLSALLGFAAGLSLYFLRAPVGRSIAVGLTSGVTIFLLLWLLNARAGAWRPTPPVPSSARAGAPRWQIPRYDRMFERPPDYSEAVRLRLRSIVDGQLTRLGVDFGSDRARALLGAGPHELLRAVPGRPPSRAELRELAAAVGHMLPADSSPPSPEAHASSTKGRPNT